MRGTLVTMRKHQNYANCTTNCGPLVGRTRTEVRSSVIFPK